MPDALIIFAAKYLIFLDAALVAAVLAFLLLYRRPRSVAFGWAVTACLLLVLSYVLARIGAALYYDGRPFVVEHFRPLIPHAADNGFPSDHALLAAALVALVALVDWYLAVPIAVLAVLVDWGRVGTGVHYVVDVVGSTLLVAVATLVALVIAPAVTCRIAPYMPRPLSGTDCTSPGSRPSNSDEP